MTRATLGRFPAVRRTLPGHRENASVGFEFPGVQLEPADGTGVHQSLHLVVVGHAGHHGVRGAPIGTVEHGPVARQRWSPARPQRHVLASSPLPGRTGIGCWRSLFTRRRERGRGRMAVVFDLLRRSCLALNDTGYGKSRLNGGCVGVLPHCRLLLTIVAGPRCRTGFSTWLAADHRRGGFDSELFRLSHFSGRHRLWRVTA